MAKEFIGREGITELIAMIQADMVLKTDYDALLTKVEELETRIAALESSS